MMLWRRLALLNAAVIGIIVAVMCFISIQTTTDLIYSEQEETCSRVISLGSTSMSTFFSTLKSRTLGLAINDELQALMTQVSAGSDEEILSEQFPRFGKIIRTTFFDANHVTVNLYAPDETGQLRRINYANGIIRLDAVTDCPDWYDTAVSNDGVFQWAVIENSDFSGLCLFKAVRSIEDHRTVLGVITVNISASVLVSELYSMQLSGTLTAYLSDETGQNLFLTRQLPAMEDGFYAGDSNRCAAAGTGEAVYVRPTGLHGLRLVWIFDNSGFTQRVLASRRSTIFIGAMLILLSFALSNLLAYQISSPLSRLSRQMEQKNQNSLRQISPPPGHPPKEIRQLYDSFNQLAANEQRLTQEIVRSELKAKDAELRATEANLRSLQAQINPHFLYNVLDSIGWMAVRYGANDIRETVNALAKMLRYSLNNGEQMITVRDEIEQVKNYVFIMQHRYPGVFTAEYEVDPAVVGTQMPKLMLQPLAENAINHGFSGLSGGGHLLIQVLAEDRGTAFYVINNGAPFDPEQVRRALHPPEGETPTSYGLRNVNDRLVERYGEPYALTYAQEGSSCVFAFVIPGQAPEKEV